MSHISKISPSIQRHQEKSDQFVRLYRLGLQIEGKISEVDRFVKGSSLFIRKVSEFLSGNWSKLHILKDRLEIYRSVYEKEFKPHLDKIKNDKSYVLSKEMLERLSAMERGIKGIQDEYESYHSGTQTGARRGIAISAVAPTLPILGVFAGKAAVIAGTSRAIIAAKSFMPTIFVPAGLTGTLAMSRKIVDIKKGNRERLSKDPRIKSAIKLFEEYKENRSLQMRQFLLSIDHDNNDEHLIKARGLMNKKFDGELGDVEDWEENLNKVMVYIYNIYGDKKSLSYYRDDERLSAFFENLRGGNCVANTKMIIGELQAAGFKLPRGMYLGVQSYIGHVQAVIVDKRGKKTKIFDILQGKWQSNPTAIVYDPMIMTSGYLKANGVRLPISEKQLIIWEPKAIGLGGIKRFVSVPWKMSTMLFNNLWMITSARDSNFTMPHNGVEFSAGSIPLSCRVGVMRTHKERGLYDWRDGRLIRSVYNDPEKLLTLSPQQMRILARFNDRGNNDSKEYFRLSEVFGSKATLELFIKLIRNKSTDVIKNIAHFPWYMRVKLSFLHLVPAATEQKKVAYVEKRDARATRKKKYVVLYGYGDRSTNSDFILRSHHPNIYSDDFGRNEDIREKVQEKISFSPESIVALIKSEGWWLRIPFREDVVKLLISQSYNFKNYIFMRRSWWDANQMSSLTEKFPKIFTEEVWGILTKCHNPKNINALSIRFFSEMIRSKNFKEYSTGYNLDEKIRIKVKKAYDFIKSLHRKHGELWPLYVSDPHNELKAAQLVLRYMKTKKIN